MKNEKTAEYFMSLPYTVLLQRDEEGDWFAWVGELEGCVAHGRTKAKALAVLDEIKKAWIEDALEVGDPIPKPEPVAPELPSGKWLQRVPRTLHRKLASLAEREGVSLNQLTTAILAERVGSPVSAPQRRTAQIAESHSRVRRRSSRN
jgi:predicted RNase H-like HicB family nuclease